MTLTAELGGAHGAEVHRVALVRGGEGGRLRVDDGWHDVALRPALDGSFELWVDGARHVVHVVQHGDEALVHACGRAWSVRLHDPVRGAGGRAREGDVYAAPMPGTVVEVKVGVGDAVVTGQTLVVLESMKMQVSLESAHDGVVAEVCCAPGDVLERDAVLVRLAGQEA